MDNIKGFINSKGYDFDVLESDLDGKFHEFSHNGQKGWFVGSRESESITFTFGDWRDPDEQHTYIASSNTNTGLKPQAVANLTKKAEEKKDKQNNLTKTFVEKIFKKLEGKTSEPPNDYFIRKKLIPTDVFFKAGDSGTQSIAMIPMRDFLGEMWNVQYIGSDGTKNFQPGGRIKGLFNVLAPFCEDDTLYFGEGYATCASFYRATGKPTLACFSASNMKHVIEEFLNDGYAASQIIVIADWDGESAPHVGNTGMIEAQKIWEKWGIGCMAPIPLSDEDSSVDFSDLWVADKKDELDVLVMGEDFFREFDFVGSKKLAVAERKKNSPILNMVTQPGPAPVVLQSPPTHTSVQQTTQASYSLGGLKLPDWLRGKPQPTLENFRELMRYVGATLRYNVIKKDQEWILPGENSSLDNRKRVLYARIMDLCRRLDMPTAEVDRYLDYLCDQNQFNPVKVWIESVGWDGVGRFKDFCGTIKTSVGASDLLKDTLIRKWMLSAVAAAYRPNGIMSPGILVLQGSQGIGKTKWFKKLVPQDLDLTADGKILRPDDKDSVKQAISYWLVELGELDATFRKSDIAQLKAFITKDTDILRLPYARQENVFPRRTLFFGSVNRREFLADDTGNRRFWVIECEGIDHEHNFDMQQIWAEILSGYLAGETWWLDGGEFDAVNQSNEGFTVMDPVEERLREKYDWDAAHKTGKWDRKTASQIVEEIGLDSSRKMELNGCAAAVRKLNGGKKDVTVRGRRMLCVASRVDQVGMPGGVTENIPF